MRTSTPRRREQRRIKGPTNGQPAGCPYRPWWHELFVGATGWSPFLNRRFPIKTSRNKTAGFTLIELIMVMVLLGVLGLMGAEFISKAFQGFKDVDNRTELFEEGKLALLRMERELRNAVPNAVRWESTTDTELRFGMIDEKLMGNVFGQYIETDPFGGQVITDPTQALAVGKIVSLYNRNWDDFSSATATFRLYRVAGTAGNAMTMNKNILASSPNRRYYAVEKVVRYRWDAGTKILYRSQDSVTQTGPGNFSSVTEYPLATNVQSLNFFYQPGSLVNNSLVSIQLTIQKGGESLTFSKEVHIRNVP